MQKKTPSRLFSLIILFFASTALILAQDKLSGTGTVSSTGAAVYSIAIETPKGAGDLKPSIGIAYNSQSGNGLVGFGCNLTGLSAITRGTKTIAHDNTVTGISYDDNSCALYLDGKRLLLKSGTEGSDGCVYAPEGEPLTNVTLHNSLTSTSCWFEVDTNDGMVYQFGYTSGRQFVSNTSAVAAWYISRADNPMGQTIFYYYSADGLYLYPQTIRYSGNNTINFTYENRSDTIFFALKDNRGYVGKRLKTISTMAGDSIFRTYTMSYNDTYDGSQTKFSRLTNIHETGENGSSSHDLTAQWNYLPNYSTSCQETVVTPPTGNSHVHYGERYLTAGDLNNDGISDIIHISSVSEFSDYYTYAHVYNSQVSSGAVSYQTPLLYRFSPNVSLNSFINQNGMPFVVDINGDGKNDLALPCVTNFTYNNSYAFKFDVAWGGQMTNGQHSVYTADIMLEAGNEIPLYNIIDVNGNGKNDIVALERQQINNHYVLHLAEYIDINTSFETIYLILPSAPKHLFTSDFNHDGLIDLMVVCETGHRIFYNQGGTSLSNLFSNSNSTWNTSIANHPRMDMGDFNGDGIADFIWNDNLGYDLKFELGNADGTYTRHTAYTFGYYLRYKNNEDGTWNCVVTDLDHDGKSDIVLNLAEYHPTGDDFNKTHTYWFISKGTRLELKKQATSTRFDDAKTGHFFAGDFRGQGFLEIGNYGYNCYNGNNANTDPTVNLYSNGYHNISKGKVSQFQDSNGRRTAFAYSSMTSDLVYTKGTGSTYPLIDIAAPLCVTSQVTESGGSPITTQTSYTYKGLRAHLQGRGLIGFTEMTATEANSGKEVKTTINSIHSNFCVPTRATITTTQGGMTATVTDSIQIKTSASSIPSNNYLPQPLFKTETDIYGHETTTYYSYDTLRQLLTHEFTVYDDNFLFFKETERVYSQEKIAGAYRPTSVFYRQMLPDSDDYYETETKYCYDEYGRKTSVIEFYGNALALTTSYVYDIYGNIIKEKYSGYGVSNDTETNYLYGSNGRFLTQKSNIAQTISYTRNVFGDVTAEIDNTNAANPLTTTYTRNAFGTLIREEKPTGEIVTWSKANTSEYGGSYCITATPNYGPKVKTWYDALGNELRTETTGIGGVEISTTNTYNAQGQVTAETSVHGNLTTTENHTYDGQGRMASSTSTDGTSVAYSYGNCSVTTTKNGQTYTKYYDLWGNVVQSDDPASSVSYLYNSLGKPREVASEGSTVVIGYDDCGNHITLDDPDAGLMTYQYDALHRIIRQTDARGYTTTFSYDGAGRMTQKTAGRPTTSYTYATSGNGAGQLASVQKGNYTISYTYDNKGRLSQETRSMTGEQPLTFSYTYDSNGRLATKTYPQNVTVSYAYDDRYNFVATAIGNKVVSLTTTDNGLQTVRKMGGQLYYVGETPMDVTNPAVIYTATYDYRGYLTSTALKRNNNSALHSMTYNFQSGTANLLLRTGMRSSAEAFTYDALERLTQVSCAGVTQQTVTYSDNGNITNKTGLGNLYYRSSPQHPHAVIGLDNAQGSMSSATLQAVYNAFGKVQSLSEGGYSLNFSYGPDEERWKTVLTNNGATIRTTLYADSYERITEDGQTRHFYYLDDGVIYVLNNGASNGTFYYASTDHLGSVTRIYDDQGTAVFSAEYDAWGKQTVTTNTIGFHRGYTGHEMLPEFGLINMNGRLYDPILGRFHSPDNFVQMPDFSQSFNRYSYCLNNPLKYKDPDGEWFFLSFISGFIRGTVDFIFNHGQWYSPFYDGYKNAINDIKISWGLFKGDTKQVLSRFTWELPQTILGLSWSKTRLVIEDIDKVRYFDGATFVINENSHSNKGVTLGSYININDKGSIPLDDNENFAPQKDPLYMHEYGHYLQSQEYGFGYLVSVGIQSIISATFSKKIDTPPYSTHNNKWFEISANKKAADYFKKKYGVSWKSYEDSYPL